MNDKMNNQSSSTQAQTQVATQAATNTTTAKLSLVDELVATLEDGKANDIVVLDVREICSFTDWMIVASGNTNRHVKALADRVLLEQKRKGNPAHGSEGELTAEWILVDFFDVVVHLMQPETREHYALEKMWQQDQNQDQAKD